MGGGHVGVLKFPSELDVGSRRRDFSEDLEVEETTNACRFSEVEESQSEYMKWGGGVKKFEVRGCNIYGSESSRNV